MRERERKEKEKNHVTYKFRRILGIVDSIKNHVSRKTIDKFLIHFFIEIQKNLIKMGIVFLPSHIFD